MVPKPCARILAAAVSSVVTWLVKFVSIIGAASIGSRSTSSCGVSTPVAAITRSTGPPSNTCSTTA